jgi:hypothetical protein
MLVGAARLCNERTGHGEAEVRRVDVAPDRTHHLLPSGRQDPPGDTVDLGDRKIPDQPRLGAIRSVARPL